ncbi:MAG TPA: TonB family protein [Fulvivirga sp.]|nr:TonB family protein [Fulvivirga sp.]
MNSIFQYFVEANLCLIVLGFIYIVFLRKEVDFKFRRGYILLSAIIIIASPLIKLPFLGVEGINIVKDIETIILPELVIGDATAAVSTQYDSYLSIGKAVGLVYLGITSLLALNFLFQLFQIGWFYKSFNRKSTKINGYKIIETNGVLPTFSFFRVIFFDNSINLNLDEKNRIIEHEIVHIRQFHSLDIVLTEIIKIIFWYNPIAWYFKNEAQDLHEFLADREVIKTTDQENYNSLLAKMTLTKAHLSLGHHFNKSKTLKRIAMMKFENKRVNQWKRAIIIPLVMLTVVVISCNDEIMQDVNTVMETASQTEMPEDLKGELAKLVEKYPDANFIYMEAEGTAESALKNLKNLDPLSIAYVKSYKDKNLVGFIVNKNGPIQNQADNNDVFTVVDEGALPQGGFEEYYKWVASELKYPEQAKKQGVQGKVYVQFIVNEIGQITEVEVVKGIGSGCDLEAIKVISASSNWSPPRQGGKAVKQRIILPITFSLGNNDSNDPANSMKAQLDFNDGMVTGVVYNDSAKPIAGVNIVIKGTNHGTVSDLDGNFKLKANKGDQLIFSFVGMKTMVLTMNE